MVYYAFTIDDSNNIEFFTNNLKYSSFTLFISSFLFHLILFFSYPHIPNYITAVGLVSCLFSQFGTAHILNLLFWFLLFSFNCPFYLWLYYSFCTFDLSIITCLYTSEDSTPQIHPILISLLMESLGRNGTLPSLSPSPRSPSPSHLIRTVLLPSPSLSLPFPLPLPPL